MTDTTELRESVLAALGRVEAPRLGRSLLELGSIHDLELSHGRATFTVELPVPLADRNNGLHQRIEETVLAVPGVTGADFRLASHVPVARAVNELLPEVRNVVAVSSGKGGVGKSTVAVNVAVALARAGARVGVLDADIYGPNVPIMFGIAEPPAVSDGRIQPHERYGVRLMSLGFLVKPEEAVIWRGPMVMHALEQLMRDVNWGALDYLLVDMPPGTGDAQLTMVQRVQMAGAVLVSTPQAVALGDTIKGLVMFQKTETPILGLVENMSLFHCPHCHQPTELFRRGTVEEACRRYSVPYLGEVPFDVECREGGDNGTPIVAAAPGSEVAQAFEEIAARIAANIALQALSSAERRVVPITRR